MPIATFAEGLHNLPQTHFLYGREALAVPYPHRWNVWEDNFFKYTAADWVVTEVGAGGTQALADADGGVLVLTADALDNDAVFVQSVGELFTFTAGKRLVFESRFKVSDATQTDFIMGLQIRDTSPLAVTDGVYFQKDDDDALLDFHRMSSSVDQAATGIHTVVNDTFLTVSYYYDGSSIVAAVNNTVVATLASVIPPTTELAVSFGVQNGTAGGKVMSIDRIFVAKEI